jgi:DNA-binding winged helix-turn-helix (wHTH) protein/tetratricopeptide (TPR) repeat protein
VTRPWRFRDVFVRHDDGIEFKKKDLPTKESRSVNIIFRNFRLDTVNQCVWRGEVRISLTPRAFAVLRYLVEHPGRLVAHDELMDALWPDTYVQPEVLRKYILEIRKVLGDQAAKPFFIETLPKRGYQFIAPVRGEGSAILPDLDSHRAGKLVGRQAALAQLDLHLKKALRGRRQLVFVTGEAGIGKTTLIDAFLHEIDCHPNLRIARGQCIEGYGGKEAYYPLLEALGRLVRDPDAAFAVQILALRAPTWLIQFPSLVRPDQKQALQQEILGATRERMVREVCEALEAITAERCLILILEDLHWVDHSTLDVISALARRREPCKLLLLGNYRPGAVMLSDNPLKALKQDLLVRQMCAEVALERFGESEIAEYLAARFPDSELPGGLAGLIRRHSDGNALFMVAILEEMVMKGIISNSQGRWMLTGQLDRIDPGIPETLRELLAISFDQLAPQEQNILKCASVAGERFSLWAVSSVLDIDVVQVEEICETLAARQQFIRAAGRRQLDGRLLSAQYEFKHTLYREFLYERLSATEGRRIHRRLAERMEAACSPLAPGLASELAFHFEEGREYERAIHYLILVSENAARRYALQNAIDVLQHAVELLSNLTPESGLELELQIRQRIGDAHYSLGEMLQSAEVYRAVADRAEQSGLAPALINALIGEASSASLFDPERCIAACERAAEVSAGQDNLGAQACAQLLASSWRIGFNGWKKDDADCCAAAIEKIGRLADYDLSSGNRILCALILYVQVQCVQSEYQAALRNVEACLPRLVESQTTWEYLSSHMAKAMALVGLGQLGKAKGVLMKGMEVSEKAQNTTWVRVFQGALAHLKYLAFDFEAALRDSEVLQKAGREAPGQAWTLNSITAGLSELELGRPKQALRRFERVRNGQVGPKSFLDWYWRMLGLFGSSSAHLSTGNLANAGRDAELFLQAALSCADRSLQGLAWAVKGQVVQAEGRWEDARDCIEKALSAMKDFETPIFALRVQIIASDFYQGSKDSKAAERHRENAKTLILQLANSFDQEDPHRESLLSAAPVRRILGRL